MREYSGIPVSPGAGVGRLVVWDARVATGEPRRIAPEGVAPEIERFRAALAASAAQLAVLAGSVRERLGADKAAIFEANAALLEDEEFIQAVIEAITGRRIAASDAVRAVTGEHAAAMATLADPYLRARASDIIDLGERLAANCLNQDPDAAPPSEDGEMIVIVTGELTPSRAALLDPDTVAAVVAERGAKTSHAAIMASALGVAAVFGAKGVLEAARTARRAAVDTTANRIVFDPDPAAEAAVSASRKAFALSRARLAPLRYQPAMTPDGRRITMLANVSSPEEAQAALANGAEGVGLFRVEYLYLGRVTLPDEQELYTAFAALVTAMNELPVVIRLLDAGGDKPAPCLNLPREDNPFLGLRGVRVGLARPEILMPQLRALWRAAALGPVAALIPMVSFVEELRQVRDHLGRAALELDAASLVRGEKLPLGVMVETPAAVALCDHLAREADFLSIGANDLTQYTLAVDRGDSRLAHLYDPLSPAVLRGIAAVATAGVAAGKPVCVCGEMAGEEAQALLLAGLGVGELSVSPGRIPFVKRSIRTHGARTLTELAAKVLAMATAAEVREILYSKDISI